MNHRNVAPLCTYIRVKRGVEPVADRSVAVLVPVPVLALVLVLVLAVVGQLPPRGSGSIAEEVPQLLGTTGSPRSAEGGINGSDLW